MSETNREYGLLSRKEVQKDWSRFHKWLWEQKQPTPYFNDPEYEKAYYDKLEQEYRARGEYP